ncbi:MAG: guanylate kinase [Betaproteobacteria bacterium]|nr:MAG: guanylate kinase [Betaproteobacteria bacterium]TMH68198.1 MAG: guanylate kinase [Betaproteobacteria bacterium]
MTVIATHPPPASGCLFVLAAPSGGGKTSLVRELLIREPGIRLSVSYTTRPPRRGEQDGVHYHFVDEAKFEALKNAGGFLEHAYVHGNWYATSATWLKQQIAEGHDVLLEIDWQGAAQVRRIISSAVLIFILPPTLASLKERLERRGQDSGDVIARRLEAAREEMRHCGEFDYVIMNQDFARAVDDLSAIVRAARLTAPRQQIRHARLIAELTKPDVQKE